MPSPRPRRAGIFLPGNRPLAKAAGLAIITPVVGNLNRIPSLQTTIQVLKSMMRVFASLLVRWLTSACASTFSRPHATEFPLATLNSLLLESVLRDRRATVRVRLERTLRPFHNSDITKYKHELAPFRETLAPFARRVPTSGQSRPASTAIRRARTETKIILAKTRRLFCRRRSQTCDRFSQRFAFTSTATAAATGAAPA